MDKLRSLEKTAIGFENSFSESLYYNFQTQDKNHLELLFDNLKLNPGKRILDLGTGSGYLAFPLAFQNHECHVIALDIVTNTIKKNNKIANERKINNLEFLSYDGEAFPFPEDYFDIVVTRYAIHHFPDIEHCFSELSRVLKSNGQLFISDPTPNKLDINRFVDKYMQMKDDGHIQFYTLEEITKIAKKFGFEKRFTTLTKIRFPRKNATKYSNLLDGAGIETLQLYEIETIKDEIFISEDVLNISFEKE